jgi:hypothetical protein
MSTAHLTWGQVYLLENILLSLTPLTGERGTLLLQFNREIFSSWKRKKRVQERKKEERERKRHIVSLGARAQLFPIFAPKRIKTFRHREWRGRAS